MNCNIRGDKKAESSSGIRREQEKKSLNCLHFSHKKKRFKTLFLQNISRLERNKRKGMVLDWRSCANANSSTVTEKWRKFESSFWFSNVYCRVCGWQGWKELGEGSAWLGDGMGRWGGKGWGEIDAEKIWGEGYARSTCSDERIVHNMSHSHMLITIEHAQIPMVIQSSRYGRRHQATGLSTPWVACLLTDLRDSGENVRLVVHHVWKAVMGGEQWALVAT